jgi:4-hydroxy-tetrahydrodipicolinate synthase
MKASIPFQGIVAYPITPFDDRNQVDLKALETIVNRLVDNGSHAIAALGSAGVLPYLSDEERECVTEATLRFVKKRIPVMIGVSCLTTQETVRHARFAESAGASAVMVIPMSYWKLTDQEILKYFDTVANAISIPIMAYNNPATAGTDMRPELLAKLLEISNVTMIKESTGDINRLHRLVQLAGDDVAFFNGSNPLALDAFVAGASGWCTAAANLIPELNLSLYQAVVEENDLKLALDVFHRQLPLLQFIVAEGLPRSVRAGLEMLGVHAGHLRQPLLDLSVEKSQTLKSILGSLSNLR